LCREEPQASSFAAERDKHLGAAHDFIHNMNQKQSEKLEALRKRKEEILERLNARIAEAQRLSDHRQRKEDIRLKILIGAAFLSDSDRHPETRTEIKAILQRAIFAERDKQFLASMGWL
jgi:hypothetical protein